MDEKDLARRLRDLRDAPEDPGPWVELAHDLERTGQRTPVLEDELFEPFLVAWSRDPEARLLERFFSVFTLLLPAPLEGAPPSWAEPARGEASVPFQAASGLPWRCQRMQDERFLWLLPGGTLALHEGASERWAHWTIRPGYVLPELGAACRNPPPDSGGPFVACFDASKLARVVQGLGEVLPRAPEQGGAPMPLSRLLGRRLAHGLTPEDREVLPAPALAMSELSELVEPAVRLGGAPPRPIEVKPARRFVEWVKDLFDW